MEGKGPSNGIMTVKWKIPVNVNNVMAMRLRMTPKPFMHILVRYNKVPPMDEFAKLSTTSIFNYEKGLSNQKKFCRI
jgi:hypothetical protein